MQRKLLFYIEPIGDYSSWKNFCDRVGAVCQKKVHYIELVEDMDGEKIDRKEIFSKVHRKKRSFW